MSTFITLENYKNHSIGKKAERLFIMLENGLNVPPLFCVNEAPDAAELLALLSEGKEFSVRSAAFCEDSHDLSFAGQFDSFLFVKRDDVLNRISACFASAQNECVRSYCEENGIASSNIKMTVIVQEMISSDFSGVLFSSNPQGILNESVIVMGAGTGDNVVEEKTEVITCYYNKNDKKYYTEKNHPDAPDIDEKTVHRLILVCSDVERIFGELVDIEFAIKDDEIFLLQSRPITTLKTDSPLIFDNSNIVESYPGISLPLTVSFVIKAYSGVFKGLANRVLRDEKELSKYDDVFLNMTGATNGRIYYKISNWYTLLSFLPLSNKIIPMWQDMMGVSDRSYDKNLVKLSFFKRAFTYFNIISEAFSIRKNMEKLNADFPATEEYFRKHFSKSSTLEDIKQIYDDVSKNVLSVWDITLLNDLYAFVFTGLLKHEIKKTGCKDYEKKTNEFISGITNIESMKPVRAMINLACSDDAMLDDLSIAKDDFELCEKLEKYPDFRQKLYEYISLYGDRSPEELKLETITYRESPLLLVKKIRELSSDEEIFERTKRLLVENDASETISTVLTKRKKRILYFAQKASIGIMNREISRLNRTRMYGMVRSLFLRAGEIFHSNGMLLDKRDVFYLTMDEIFYGDPNEFISLIDTRKERYAAFRNLPAFSRIIFSGKEFDKNLLYANSVSKVTSDEQTFMGTPSSTGVVTGEAVIVTDACNPPDTKGRIIVAKMTDPGWVFLLSNSKGIVSEKGSLLSHTAIISRELKIPSVVGVKDISEFISDGDIIELNGDVGTVTILKRKNQLKNPNGEKICTR